MTINRRASAKKIRVITLVDWRKLVLRLLRFTSTMLPEALYKPVILRSTNAGRSKKLLSRLAGFRLWRFEARLYNFRDDKAGE